MIRFGDMTEDELFVSAEAAHGGVRIENLSASDPLVILKHFGPGNPDAEPLRKSARTAEIDDTTSSRTNGRPFTTPCGPASSARGPIPSRRSISTPCSISRRRPRRTATKFDGVDLFLFDPHVSIDATDDDLDEAARQDRRARLRRRLAGGAGVAADRRRRGDGQRRRPQELRDAGAQGVRDRPEAAGPRHPHLRRRPHRLGRRARATGPRIPQGNTKKIADTFRRGVRRGRGARRDGSPPKARSAGAACTAGSG